MDHLTTSSNQQYINQRITEASQIDFANKEYRRVFHIANLKFWSPEAYYDMLKERDVFPRFKAPAKRLANKDVGITVGLRLYSLFNADAKKRLARLKEQAEIKHQKEVQEALAWHNRRADAFYKNQDNQHRQIEHAHQLMRAGDAAQITSYFYFVLHQDDFTTDFLNRYPIGIEDMNYDKASGKLSFAYRLPSDDEILAFQSFQYDQEQDEVLPEPVGSKEKQTQRTNLARKILLRSIILIYRSDAYYLVKDIEITGFLFYYDPSYGQERRKDIIRVHMNRSEYSETDLTRVDVNALFANRLKAKESSGLYSKNPLEIIDIHTKQNSPPSVSRKKPQKDKKQG